MSRDASGNYTLPNDSSAMAANTLADVSEVNGNFADLATELQDSLSRSGKGAMLAALKAVAGTLAAPGITFDGDTDTGIYRSATNTMVLVAAATAIATITASGINLGDLLLQRPVLKDYAETVNAIGSIGGGTQDIDLEDGNVVTATVDTGATTFTFSNPPASGKAGSFTLFLTNGGSQTVNWPASVDWAGGSAPSLTASGVDVLTFMTVDGGTTWYGFPAGLDMS